MSRRLLFCFLSLFLSSVLPGTASAAERQPSRVLFVTQSVGFTHGVVNRQESGAKNGKKDRPSPAELNQLSLSPAEVALTQLGEQTGLFKVDCTQDCEADFTKENLQNYDIVAFYTTGNLPISPEALTYFFGEWLKQPGHGVLGLHSAMDTFHEYEPYWDMIGGTFISHPWTSNANVTLTNLDPTNPLVQSFGKEFPIQEEIYMYRHWQPEKVRVLMSLDYAKSPLPEGRGVNTEFGYHVPVCWIKQYGEGRVYCNNLGHNPTTWTNPAYLESLTQAVRWIRRDIDVETAPNPKVSAAQEEKARKDFVEFGFQKAVPKVKKQD
ncbi:ThuA domain-containing protein [Planctomicrobium sp. SH664]|uniref:ThuA domain-containing protein n=1 Tax=Planctomicrobium sp. SH664 TaxID=3448125 RepID=UPI003F5C6618